MVIFHLFFVNVYQAGYCDMASTVTRGFPWRSLLVGEFNKRNRDSFLDECIRLKVPGFDAPRELPWGVASGYD
jgi:hypothetical protein